MEHIDRGRRIRRFTWLFLGIVYDFWRESRVASRIGGRAARERMSARHRRRAIQFRETAIDMGGVVIKLGQFFSARVDIMPDEYIQELAKLQDTVPPVPFDEIKTVVESEFGRPLDEIFVEFNPEALAAASLAQVHMAVLKSGEEVAVKVQRPGIGALVDIDLATYAYLMNGVHRFTRFGQRIDIPMVINEFCRTLGDELDFHREAFNAERFREIFAGDDKIHIPSVHWEYSGDLVLTLEAIDGIKISDYEKIEAAGIDRHEVADEVFQSYLRMVLEAGFFHADPHPGNLFVSEGPLITFVDFGMVGEITPEMQASLSEAIVGIARKDATAIVTSFGKLGFVRRGADTSSIVRALDWMFDHYGTINARNITFDAILEIEEDILRIIHEQPITVPAQFAFLGRAISTLLGLATGLDPEFDFVGATRPYVNKMTKAGSAEFMRLAAEEAKNMAKLFLALPKQLNDALTKIQKGELNFKVDAASVTKALNRSNQNRRRWARVAALAALLATTAYLFNTGLGREAYFFSALAAVLVVSVVRR